MNIVINLQPITGVTTTAQNNFIQHYLFKMIAAQEMDHFFLITTCPAYQHLLLKNITLLTSTPTSKNAAIWKLWYAYRLPRLLKKCQANVFVNLDANCSLKTAIPQLLLMPQYSFNYQTQYQQKGHHLFFTKATRLVTASAIEKNSLCNQYLLPQQNIAITYTGATNNFVIANDAVKEAIKEKYTKGREYFFFTGELSTASNLINLLKAFSFFKKRQKSNMQLLISTATFLAGNSFMECLKNYKYREEVVVLVDIAEAEQVQIIAAAYALVYVPLQNDYYVPVLQAMQCAVPVITGDSPIMKEICGDAVVYTDPAVFENIADKMMLIFKDEDKRNHQITKGTQQVQQYSAALTTASIWQNILQIAAQ